MHPEMRWGENVYLVSVPRDSFIMIHDENGEPTNKEKANAAFSAYGPTGAVATIEALSGLRMKHLAIIDWEGFKDLSTAVGGVPVFIPEKFTDPKQKTTWEQGEQNLKGDRALKYVRTRYGLPGGDFDRIARQQNFLRALMKKILAGGTMKNPVRLTNTL